MPDINNEQIDHIARLARITLTEKEEEKAANELGAILTYIEKLNEVDTKGVEPTAQVTGLTNVFRPDEITSKETNPEMLVAAAPAHERGYVKVPAIFEAKK